jgi:transcriptional regulator with XRE-family HTH domain
MNIRDVVKRRMKARGYTANKLAGLAEVYAGTLYAFLKGKTLNSTALGKILDVLEISLVPRELPPIEPPPLPPVRVKRPNPARDEYAEKIRLQRERGIERRARAAERKERDPRYAEKIARRAAERKQKRMAIYHESIERMTKADGPLSRPPSDDAP